MSRRDVLKYGAMAVAAVGVSGLQLGGTGGRATAEAASTAAVAGAVRNDLSRFVVDIQGMPVASANIQEVQLECLTIDVRETTTGVDWDFRTYAPGDAHFGHATFRSRVGRNSKELVQWLQDASVGKNVRKNIAVIILDRAGAEARRFNLMDCFPIKYDPGDYSPSFTTRVESITVKIGHVEFA